MKLQLTGKQLGTLLEEHPEVELELLKGTQEILLNRLSNKVRLKVEELIFEKLDLAEEANDQVNKALKEKAWYEKIKPDAAKKIREIVESTIREEIVDICREVMAEERESYKKLMHNRAQSYLIGEFNKAFKTAVRQEVRFVSQELVGKELVRRLGVK